MASTLPALHRDGPYDEPYNVRNLLPAILLGAGLLVMTIVKTLTALPSDGSVAAIFPPWSDTAANWSAIATADGLVTRQLAGGMILVVTPARPGLAERLRRSNALALINPGAVGGCWSP